MSEPRTDAGRRLQAALEEMMARGDAPAFLAEALREWIRTRIVEVELEASTLNAYRPARSARKPA